MNKPGSLDKDGGAIYGYLSRAPHVLMVILLLSLTACGLLGNDQTATLGHQTQLPPQSEAILTCSQACADRGWCGTLPDQRAVVMGNAGNPVTEPQDRIFLQDTVVFINRVNMGLVESVTSGEQANLPFYNVIEAQSGKSAWVPGWCIMAP